MSAQEIFDMEDRQAFAIVHANARRKVDLSEIEVIEPKAGSYELEYLYTETDRQRMLRILSKVSSVSILTAMIMMIVIAIRNGGRLWMIAAAAVIAIAVLVFGIIRDRE